MFNKQDPEKNALMLDGSLMVQGYDWWWHSFTARNAKTGEEKPFFIEFFLCNPGLGRRFPVLGQLPENKMNNKKPSYLMVKAGCWGENPRQIHRFFGWEELWLTLDAPYAVEVDDCFASDAALRGSVCMTTQDVIDHPEYMCNAGSMSWDLEICKDIAFNVGYGTSKLFRDIKAFEMYWHAEGMKTYYRGTVTLDGEEYIVEPENCYGYADKNWGKGFTSPWVWLSSNCLYSNLQGKWLENSVFDIGGGRPKIYFVPLERKLLSAFYYEGKEYEYNFSKFWMSPHTRFATQETEDEVRWKIWQENYNSVVKVEVRCKKQDMILVNYEAPDGSKRHNRLWNGGNGVGRIKLYKKKGKKLELIDDIKATHIGCEFGEYDSRKEMKAKEKRRKKK